MYNSEFDFSNLIFGVCVLLSHLVVGYKVKRFCLLFKVCAGEAFRHLCGLIYCVCFYQELFNTTVRK